MQLIKMEDIFNYDNVVTQEIRFFQKINTAIENLLDSSYGIESSEYEESVLYNFLDNYGEDLDTDYFLEHSSEKYISKFFKSLIDKELTMTYMLTMLAQHIAVKFGFNWYKLSIAYTTEYKPLENYDMEEIRTPNLTENLTRKQKQDVNVHQDSESGIYGFNSNESQPTATGTGDTHTTGSNLNNEIADTKTNTGNEKLTRHGNIGVTTSQQMLESEIKLRHYDFIEEVFNNIDSILCLKIY